MQMHGAYITMPDKNSEQACLSINSQGQKVTKMYWPYGIPCENVIVPDEVIEAMPVHKQLGSIEHTCALIAWHMTDLIDFEELDLSNNDCADIINVAINANDLKTAKYFLEKNKNIYTIQSVMNAIVAHNAEALDVLIQSDNNLPSKWRFYEMHPLIRHYDDVIFVASYFSTRKLQSNSMFSILKNRVEFLMRDSNIKIPYACRSFKSIGEACNAILFANELSGKE